MRPPGSKSVATSSCAPASLTVERADAALDFDWGLHAPDARPPDPRAKSVGKGGATRVDGIGALLGARSTRCSTSDTDWGTYVRYNEYWASTAECTAINSRATCDSGAVPCVWDAARGTCEADWDGCHAALGAGQLAVSYTHLTLPTKRIV